MIPAPANLAGIAPFFIVRDLAATIAFYRDRMGFEVTFQVEGPDPFFAIISRGSAAIHLKCHEGVEPVPNFGREPAFSLDAYVEVPNPDALAAEFASRGVSFAAPLSDSDDGLRGFVIKDLDGYGLFFGHHRE